jgi:Fe-S oxidoreductase
MTASDVIRGAQDAESAGEARDAYAERLAGLTTAEAREVGRIFLSRLDARTEAYLNACVRCGLCADTCHYHRTDGEAASIPAHKLDLLAAAYRRESTLVGRFAPGLVGAAEMTPERVRDWVDAFYGRCSLCGRCALNCTIGIHLPALFRAARGALAVAGLLPPELDAAITTHRETGNSMAVTREEWLETVAWLEEELRLEPGFATARLPLDEKGARILYTVNPREAKFFPLSIVAAAKIFHVAGESWTMSSALADLTNYGLFSGEAALAGPLSAKLVTLMQELGTEELVIGECGHGFAANRWEAPEWFGRSGFPVRSVLELFADYLAAGRLRLDPQLNAARMTLHDPCNLVRMGGVVMPQRRILAAAASDFVEMTPHGIQNFCCGGGGGQLALTRYAERRIATGGIKAEQIRATGAKVVVTPCHNCVDQLMELGKVYKLGIQIKTVGEILADALVSGE